MLASRSKIDFTQSIAIPPEHPEEKKKGRSKRWVKCGQITLYQNERNILTSGKWLSDLHTNAATRATKEAIPEIRWISVNTSSTKGINKISSWLRTCLGGCCGPLGEYVLEVPRVAAHAHTIDLMYGGHLYYIYVNRKWRGDEFFFSSCLSPAVENYLESKFSFQVASHVARLITYPRWTQSFFI